MTLIDRSIAKVRGAVRQIVNRSALARAAGVRDTVLRDVLLPHWNPTADTLRKLETAAVSLGVDGDVDGAVHGDSDAANLGKGTVQ